MIEGINLNDDSLIWENDGNEYSYDIGKGTFINDDNNILIMNGARNGVIALDKNGERVGEISSCESVYLMYLQKHPRFGLSVVASIKDEDGKWQDKYMSFSSGKFEIVSNSR